VVLGPPTARIAAITVCVVVAGAVAGTGLATMPGTPPGPQYASLPTQPCSIVRSADVARYMPGATGIPLSIPGSSQVRIGTCKWSAGVGGEDKTLLTQAVIFGRLDGDPDGDPVDAAGMVGGTEDQGVSPGGDPERFGDLVEQ
jgi:hypothetical protein